MANRVVRTTTQSWFSRLANSFFGVLFGIGLFLCSFVVLWVNEGRTDLSTIADDSIAVSAAAIDPANEGKLVAAAGVLEAESPLGDPDYLRPAAYLTLERNVEMYAWVERTESESERNLGGSETTTTEYSYATEWTSNPRDSSSFEVPRGHDNPALAIEEREFTASAAHVGRFSVDVSRMSLPSSQAVALNEQSLVEGADGEVVNNYIFIGRGTMQNPEVGDVRISFSAVPGGQNVTAFGLQQGSALAPYVRGRDTLYLAHTGDRAAAIEALHSSHVVMGWIFRAVGFIMMWIGLGLLTGPLSTFLDVVPILGGLSRNVLGVVMGGVALILTGITVFIAALAQNPLALVVVAIFILAIVGFIYWRGKSAAPATAEAA